MMRLQRRKEVELERDARMARRHDAMGDELAAGRRTEMAVDANPRAHHRVLELLEPRRQVRQMLAPHFAVGIRVRPDARIVAREPAARRAMADRKSTRLNSSH